MSTNLRELLLERLEKNGKEPGTVPTPPEPEAQPRKLVKLTLMPDAANDLWLALTEYIIQRTPVREYVDKRYSHMDLEFRNEKIGELQTMIRRLQHIKDKL